MLAPVIDAIVRDAQAFLMPGRNRVVEADALDESPIAPTARIGDDDVVKRPLLGAAARESDDHHVRCPVRHPSCAAPKMRAHGPENEKSSIISDN